MRLYKGVDISKPCTRLTANLSGTETQAGYQELQIISKSEVRLEKAELELIK
jgi:hypothetical protein